MKLSKSGHRLLEDSRAAALFFPADVYRGVETKTLLADVQSEEVVIRPEISPVNADQVCGNRPFRIGIIGDQFPPKSDRLVLLPAVQEFMRRRGDFSNAEGTPPHLDRQ